MSELKYGLSRNFLTALTILFFKPLTRAEVKEIVKLVINTVSDRLAEKEMKLEISGSALDYIVQNGGIRNMEQGQ